LVPIGSNSKIASRIERASRPEHENRSSGNTHRSPLPAAKRDEHDE
jgi:hypothetical protein